MNSESDKIYEIMIESAQAGQRLDKALGESLAGLGLSRSRLQKLIEGGHVADTRNATQALSTKIRVQAGACYRVTIPDPEDAEPQAEAIPLDVHFEDEALLVLNKPAGMVVHPAPGSPKGTLVNALLAHCGDSLSGIGGVRRPGIVHRIDKDTSGLLVIAKSDRAHTGLAAQFAEHSIDRLYDAICWGVPKPASGHIEGALGRHPVDRKRMAVREDGRWARTHFRVVEDYYLGAKVVAARIECRLETGRTHQVRVHMTHIGHPLVGDPVYGRARQLPANAQASSVVQALKTFQRQALHARSLSFDHPISGKRLHFSAEFPSDMKALAAAFASAG